MDQDEALDRIYSAPLAGFTATRDAVAAELKADGDHALSQRVKGLKKPSVTVWALNQLARAYPDEIRELFEANDRLRGAQRKVLGGGKPGVLRDATDERNRAVARLVKLARTIIEDGGHAVAQQTTAAINDSLVATASDTEGAELLRAGRLGRQLKAEASVEVGALGLVRNEPDQDTRVVTLSGARVAAELRSAVDEARRLVAQAHRAVEEAEAENTRLAESVEFARRATEARRGEAAEAERKLAEAEAALREAASSKI